jgi:competence protein ComEA
MPQRSRTQHQEAVSRRLAQLSAELAASRPDLPAPEGETEGGASDDWWAEHTRVAAPRPAPRVVSAPPEMPAPAPAPAQVVEDELAPAVPRPGRHAARRRLAPGRAVADLVPEPLRGPVGLGPAQLAVVAVLVAIGLAVTCWWVVRGDAEPAPGRPEAAAPASPVGSAAALETPSAGPEVGGGLAGETSVGSVPGEGVPAGEVTVDVAGKVRRPGIAVLESGSRVVDAIEAAGGARPGVDLSSLNLARVLVDGEQVLVGAPVAPAAAAVPGTSAAPAGSLVNLNTATAADLELLPEVGPVTAGSIVAWRDEHGGFTSVDELLEVDGIGDKTLATIAPHVTV